MKWTEEETSKLLYLYANGGDKGCLSMGIIAKRLKRSKAACWAKLLRVVRS